MNEIQPDVIKLQNSLYRLRGMHLNIPEILYSVGHPRDEIARQAQELALKATAMVLRPGNKLVIPIYGYNFVSVEEVKKLVQSYKGEAFLMLRYPAFKPILQGECIPGPMGLKFIIGSTETVINWTDRLKLSIPPGLRRSMGEIVDKIYTYKGELDGARIRFSCYIRGVGMDGGVVLFWGYTEAA